MRLSVGCGVIGQPVYGLPLWYVRIMRGSSSPFQVHAIVSSRCGLRPHEFVKFSVSVSCLASESDRWLVSVRSGISAAEQSDWGGAARMRTSARRPGGLERAAPRSRESRCNFGGLACLPPSEVTQTRAAVARGSERRLLMLGVEFEPDQGFEGVSIHVQGDTA